MRAGSTNQTEHQFAVYAQIGRSGTQAVHPDRYGSLKLDANDEQLLRNKIKLKCVS